MEILQLEGTPSTPSISLNPQTKVFEISGYSRPENVREFYGPVLDWLTGYKNFLEKTKEQGKEVSATTVIFRMIYFNSSSAKFICDVIILLRDICRSGFEVNINWQYEETDTEMLEAGEELSDMSDFNFSFIPYV